MRITAWQWQRICFWLATGLFVTTRLATLLSFPIFNDEAIYLQYSQFIHEDFRTYKFVSMNNIFQDWKPPLQYWLGSTVVQLGDNPVLMGRLVAFAIPALGFFGMYLLSRQLFGKTTAVWSLLIYALCPPVMFYNNQFVAETFVFTLISRPAMPAAYDQIKNTFDARWTLSLREVLRLPESIWLANGVIIGNYFKRYYTLWTVPLLLAFAIVAIRRRSAPDIVLGLMFLAASGAVLFFVKSFK